MARRRKSKTSRRSTSWARVIFSKGAPQDSLLWLLLGIGILVAIAYLM